MMLLMGVPVQGGRVACRPTTPDSATISVEGDRTVPSSVLKATMQTADSMEDVLAFYRRLLIRTPDNDVAPGLKADVGRSVIFNDESEGRPFAFHVISVNSGYASTTLIVTRGESEQQTRITWEAISATRTSGVPLSAAGCLLFEFSSHRPSYASLACLSAATRRSLMQRASRQTPSPTAARRQPRIP
jgi:hypothetical protein